MAREWALAGVSEEELHPTPSVEPPKTPKGKWQNFWYHYKWTTLLIAALVIIVGVFVWQMVTKDNPDYHVVVVTEHILPLTAQDELKKQLTAYGEDVDGDGKVEVLLENVYLSTVAATNQTVVANATKLTNYLATRDVVFFVMEPDYYEERIASHLDADETFFATLKADETLPENGCVWNWNGSDLYKAVKKRSSKNGVVPKDLYFGVRQAAPNARDDDVAAAQNAAALVERLIAGQNG